MKGKTAWQLLKISGWIVATPLVVLLLVFTLLYVPAVQQWTVNTAAEYLSKEMGMDVAVKRVRLKFPFDLSIEGVTARKNGTTMLDARSLVLNIEAGRLFGGEVVVSRFVLNDVTVNTLDMFEGIGVSGKVGEATTSNLSFALSSGKAVVPTLSLRHADLMLTISDSIPTDTTESEPQEFVRLVELKNIALEDLRLTVNLADSMCAGVVLGKGGIVARLDLEHGDYFVDRLKIEQSEASFDMGGLLTMQAEDSTMQSQAMSTLRTLFDPNHIRLTGIQIDVTETEYRADGSAKANINRIAAKEHCGLTIEELKGQAAMDSTAISLQDFSLQTAASSINLAAQIDMSLIDQLATLGTATNTASNDSVHLASLPETSTSSVPASDGEVQSPKSKVQSPKQTSGNLTLATRGSIGKSDIVLFSADMSDLVAKTLPDNSLDFDLSASGNMQQMAVDRFAVGIDNAFHVSGDAMLTDLLSGNADIGVDSHIEARTNDLAWVKQFLPAEAQSAIHIPRGISLKSDIAMHDQKVRAKVRMHQGEAKVSLDTDYDMSNDRYAIDLDADNLWASDYITLLDTCIIDGGVKLSGQGFDFDSPRTTADLESNIDFVKVGPYYLDSTSIAGTLRDHRLDATFDFTDPRLIGQFRVDGNMTNSSLDANVTIDLPFADVQALGFSDEPFTAHATHGTINATSDFGEMFFVDASIEGVEVVLGRDSLITDRFVLQTENSEDSIGFILHTGDLDVNFHAPYNLFRLIEQFQAVGKEANRQMAVQGLNLNDLKQMVPDAYLDANIGRNNPVSKFVRMQGYDYDEVVAHLHTSSTYGLQGGAHVYRLGTEEIVVDTISFNLEQDSTQLGFALAAVCERQGDIPALAAHLDGFISPRYTDIRLTMLDEDKKKSLDIGLKGEAAVEDSVMHLTVFPEKPIIAYHEFEVNDDNFIDLYKRNRMFANVQMKSLSDNCRISIVANPDTAQLQNIKADIADLNIAEILTLLPLAPKMEGMLNVGADYVLTEEGQSVDGLVSALRFAYEGTHIGDLMSAFKYKPVGETQHQISAMVFIDDQDIANVAGTYDAADNGRLNASVLIDRLPMTIASAFVPDQICALSGSIDGLVSVAGPVDTLLYSGQFLPNDIHVFSDVYSFDLSVANEPVKFSDSRINLNDIKIFGAGDNPLSVNGFVDFANLDEVKLNLSLYGQNFPVFNAPRTRNAALFGKLNGDFFARVNGTTNDLQIRGLISVLNSTDITYIMTNTPLTVDYRLDDIVTFVDFSAPPDAEKIPPHTFMGVDMLVNLEIEDGANIHCEFSADKQSYLNVQGGGSLRMTYSPEGVLQLTGRYTINEGEMKYTLPVIPLKTFHIEQGSYVEFTGKPMNPTLRIAATEETKASVSNPDGSSRTVTFDTGLRISNTLENMGLEFIIAAPEDITVQNELAGMTAEEKNKLAVAMLATGMYLSGNNENGFSASNALNNFLQNEINNIAGKAMQTAVNVDMSVGMEQTRRDDGTTRTDYAFRFTKRFFSDRLNVVIGGRINADGNRNETEAGTYIDDISLEWRLDKSGSQYVRLFHDKNYDNLIEGEMIENGGGVLFKKKADKFSDLLKWSRIKEKTQMTRDIK